MSKSLKASLRKTLAGVIMMTTIFSLSGVVALVPSAQAATIVDGDVVRNPSASGDAQFDVYIVKLMGAKKFKRLVLNPQVFNSYGHLKWENVKTVTTEEMNSYKTSGIVRVETDPKVLALAPNGDMGSKSWLNVSAADFVAAGGDWESVYTINAVDGANYAAAADLTSQAQVATYLTTGALPGGVVPTTGTVTVSLNADTPASGTLVTSVSTNLNGSQALAPMVKLNFANATNGEVKVTTLKLTRTGIAADTDLTNVYLYKGNTKLAEMTSVSSRVYSFVNASGLFSINAGQTEDIMVKADIADNLSGKSIGLGVASAADVVTNGGTVGGTFPVNGNVMGTATVTDLGRLTVGTAVTIPSSVDPGMTAREILRFNAIADNQNLQISYIKLTNVGTIANTDLANIKLMDGATQLGSTLNSLAADGTAVFDLGSASLAITSGNSKTLTVLADIVGGTNRNFKLTVQRQSDIVARDVNYGINIKPYTTVTNSGVATDEVFAVFPASATAATTISTGTLTITVDSSSPSGNVALNSTNITLAKFKFISSGEAVKVSTLPAVITIAGTAPATTLKNVKMMLDGSQVGTTQSTVTSGTAFNVSSDFGSSFIIPAGSTGKIVSIVGDIKENTGVALAAGHTITAALNAGTAQGQTSLSAITTSSSTGRLLTVQSGALSVAKNLAVGDATSTIPTAVKGATGAKIGSFVLTAGAGEGVSVSQIQVTDSVTSATEAVANGSWSEGTASDTLTVGETVTATVTDATKYKVGETYGLAKTGTLTTATTITIVTAAGVTITGTIGAAAAISDAGGADGITLASAFSAGVAANDTLADTFQNLKLMMGSTQVGTTVGTLTDFAVGGTATVYTFTPSTAIQISAGQQVVFDLLADVKSGATTLSVNKDASGIVTFTLATATGLVTNGNANTTTTPTLQVVHISSVGVLAIAVDGSSPISQQVVMGTTGVEIAKFKLSETSSGENVTVSAIVLRDTDNAAASHGTLSNVQLLDGTTVLGTAASLTNVDGTHANTTFNGLNITVNKGQNKVLTVKADITAFPGGASASTHLLDITGFTGTGASSGTALTSGASTGTAGTMTAYKTKLTIALASDTPSGASTGSLAQTVAKFVVSNSSNVGSYDATLQSMTVNMSSTITNTANSLKYITFYKNAISGAAPTQGNVGVGTGNALASIGVEDVEDATNPCASAAQLTCVLAAPATKFTNTAILDAAFTDVTIAAGSSVTIIVVADTDNAAATNNFSAGIASTGITWSDGTTSAIATVDSLPIIGRTLTY